jgi:hypothetical protein
MSRWKRPPHADRVLEVEFAGIVTGVLLQVALEVGIGAGGVVRSELKLSILQSIILPSRHA